MTDSICIRLDYPPSMNHYWRRVGNRTLISRGGRAYRESVALDVSRAFADPPLIDTPLSVSIDLIMPDNRRRDVDNVLKSLLDAMAHAGLYRDDSQIRKLTIQKMHVESPGCCDVTITPITAADAAGETQC